MSYRTEAAVPIALALSRQTSRAVFQALAPVWELVPRADAPAAAIRDGNVSVERRLSFLRQHGSFTLAYSAAVQRGLDYFGDENGFIAYRMVGGTALVLADPVAAVADRAKLIREFLAVQPKVSFWQVSRPTAEILASMGFVVNEMGTDIRIDLPGYKRKSLRHDFNRATRAGTVIKEASAAEIGIDAIRDVSDRWRRMRTFKEREVAFLNRPIVLEDEPDVRKFFAFDRDGKLVAFAYYDPIYEDGRVVGYSTSFKRRLPEADANICNGLLHVAMESFRAEGRKCLYLGLSPMADIEDKDFRPNKLLSAVFRWSFASPLFNRYVYPLKGHASHKRDYRGTAEHTYFAFRSGFSLAHVEKMLRACYRMPA
jgi:phosphatidylglycerol lysyltransferase